MAKQKTLKNFAFLFLIIGILSSCNKEDDIPTATCLTGEWKLVENYVDPGDGSGSFRPVESEKRITFHSDGTVTSNGTICDMSIDADSPTSGTYSLAESAISSPDCGYPDYNYEYEQSGNELIIKYPCIEGCGAKYRKE